MTNDTMKKKYILRPGFHQFAPGSAAIHSNENLSDEEAEWYLQRYPHIEAMFAPLPPEEGVIKPEVQKKVKDKRQLTEGEISNKGGSI